MSTTPQRYRPSQRLIDNPQRLAELYHERDMTIREIAEQKASVSKTRVCSALHEYDITDDTQYDGAEHPDDEGTSTSHGERGVDPPNWSEVQ
jgi:hypothetical protein